MCLCRQPAVPSLTNRLLICVSGSPFLPGMVPPGLPTPNDTLLTLWNLYNSRQAAAAASPPPVRRHEPPPAAPAPAPAPTVQSEALNLGVHRDMAR